MTWYLAATIFLVASFVILGFYTLTDELRVTSTATAQTTSYVSTDANFKVAFFADTEIGTPFQNVLTLVKNEGAQAIVVPGDLSYGGSFEDQKWINMVNNTLGANFPVFITKGNHEDSGRWNESYGPMVSGRIQSLGYVCTGQTGASAGRNTACKYKGLHVVMSDAGESGKEDSPGTNTNFINSALSGSNSIWRVCAWHRNQEPLNGGGKGSDVGWAPFEACRQQGAIIVNGHEHSYTRTKSLVNMVTQQIDSVAPEAASPRVAPGSTFVAVVGTGGNDGLDGVPSATGYWAGTASVHGAMFITFNNGGNPRSASGYFKTTGGAVRDQFTLTSAVGTGAVPPPPPPSIPPPPPPPPPPSIPPPPPPSGGACTGPVTLYQHDFYDGYSAGFNPGNYTFAQLQACGVEDNKISSIRVTSGYRAILYDSDNFGGTSLVRTGDDDSLNNDGWNDRMSSVRIESTSTPPPPSIPPPPPPPSSDFTPPILSITNPVNGATLPYSQSVAIQATASDASGISQVSFLVNNQTVGTDSSSPYSASWNPSLIICAQIYPNRCTVTISAIAVDGAGNSASRSVTVAIQNTSTPPPPPPPVPPPPPPPPPPSQDIVSAINAMRYQLELIQQAFSTLANQFNQLMQVVQ